MKVIKQKFILDSTICKCVYFILSNDSVAMASWGGKKLSLKSCGELLVPKLTRNSTIKDMYLWHKDIVWNDVESLKVPTFYTICNVLTRLS